MELEPIIAALRSRCPALGERVAGAADFEIIPESTALQVPCAFVIPLDDNPEDNAAENGLNQRLVEAFAVVVALDNRRDERGQAASATAHSMRRDLWKALLRWIPAEDYGPIQYEGKRLLRLDRSRMWMQYEFSSDFFIGDEDGWQLGAQENLPRFEGADIRVDVIDPISQPSPGPDGRIEFQAQVNNLPE